MQQFYRLGALCMFFEHFLAQVTKCFRSRRSSTSVLLSNHYFAFHIQSLLLLSPIIIDAIKNRFDLINGDSKKFILFCDFTSSYVVRRSILIQQEKMEFLFTFFNYSRSKYLTNSEFFALIIKNFSTRTNFQKLSVLVSNVIQTYRHVVIKNHTWYIIFFGFRHFETHNKKINTCDYPDDFTIPLLYLILN